MSIAPIQTEKGLQLAAYVLNGLRMKKGGRVKRSGRLSCFAKFRQFLSRCQKEGEPQIHSSTKKKSFYSNVFKSFKDHVRGEQLAG